MPLAPPMPKALPCIVRLTEVWLEKSAVRSEVSAQWKSYRLTESESVEKTLRAIAASCHRVHTGRSPESVGERNKRGE